MDATEHSVLNRVNTCTTFVSMRQKVSTHNCNTPVVTNNCSMCSTNNTNQVNNSYNSTSSTYLNPNSIGWCVNGNNGNDQGAQVTCCHHRFSNSCHQHHHSLHHQHHQCNRHSSSCIERRRLNGSGNIQATTRRLIESSCYTEEDQI